MPSWIVKTLEYDINLPSLLKRRLRETGFPYALSRAVNGVGVTLEGEEGAAALSKALASLLGRDLQLFVLAAMADETPLPLGEKREILSRSTAASRSKEDLKPLEKRLQGYLQEERVLCLEGFLRFRMPETLLFWQLCVEQAASELLMKKEYREVTEILRYFVESRPPKSGPLQLCLHEDGSCTLTDENALRIEYVDGSEDGLLSLLVSMAPEELILYDLSGKKGRKLTETLACIFSGRIKIFR